MNRFILSMAMLLCSGSMAQALTFTGVLSTASPNGEVLSLFNDTATLGLVDGGDTISLSDTTGATGSNDFSGITDFDFGPLEIVLATDASNNGKQFTIFEGTDFFSVTIIDTDSLSFSTGTIADEFVISGTVEIIGGTPTPTLGDWQLSGTFNNDTIDSGSFFIATPEGSLQTVVPLPASVLFLLGGLGGLAALRRRAAVA